MKSETFLQIFGDIDEKYIEEAADDEGDYFEGADEGVVVHAGDPRKMFWRTFIASVACTAAVAVGAVFLMRNVLNNGFTIVPSSSNSSSVQNEESSGDSTSSDESSGESASSDESSVSVIPYDQIPFLIGPDGKAIRKSEITGIWNTDKTVATLTEDDLGAEIYCEGFAYYKEPCGVGYDSLKNPELFYGSDFIGEVPENKNEWKRVYVGDEIFGLKVKTANAYFHIDDRYDFTFPARYYCNQGYSIELEGTIEAEGFLQVNNKIVPDNYYSAMIYFYPTTMDLPLVPIPGLVDKDDGFVTRFEAYRLFNASQYCCAGEFTPIPLGYYNDTKIDNFKMGVGDIAYARVTLGDIRYLDGSIEAKVEKVVQLTGILDHIDDLTEPIYPSSVYPDSPLDSDTLHDSDSSDSPLER